MMLYLGSKPTLIVSSPDAAEIVLKRHDLDFASRPQAKFVGRLIYNFTDMGFSPYGEYWRNLRSICVIQLLSNKRVQSFRSVREEEVALMVEKIAESCMSHSPFNITEMSATLTNNIISRVVIGRRYSEEKSGSNFKKIFEEFLELFRSFNVGDYIPWLEWINHINGLEAKVNRVAKELDEYFENIVEEGMKRHEKILRSRTSESEKEVKAQKYFLDILLELQMENINGFTLQRDSVKALILDMFTAGTDTTSTLLEWTITELVKNKIAMAKLTTK
ncbi:OLC1v1008035C1 [Oldenlandia corymbosa var. corymbosa]|uniref:OLC1v1008035C1 n=1 Tax=Oldenlandia corymbosa var. corymbosa TaxID=529605 RepID=A0AAV1DKN2_OLDCO|nr:OLC1v1008035C1 [Oldenlandia corymbosa var. corymbosa]